MWHNRENGVTTSKFETKRFQGLGPDSRHAKDAATKLALVKLRNYMPGKALHVCMVVRRRRRGGDALLRSWQFEAVWCEGMTGTVWCRCYLP